MSPATKCELGAGGDLAEARSLLPGHPEFESSPTGARLSCSSAWPSKLGLAAILAAGALLAARHGHANLQPAQALPLVGFAASPGIVCDAGPEIGMLAQGTEVVGNAPESLKL